MTGQNNNIDDEELDNKVRSILSKHKLMKKREHVDKELSRSNSLLSKYDTTRVLALRARSKLTEKREMERQVNMAVTNNEDGDEAEFLDRVKGFDFSENVIASPERGSLRPRSAPSGRKKVRPTSAPLHRKHDPVTTRPTTPKSDRKKSKKKGSYQSDLDFYDPPQLPSPIPLERSHSPTLNTRQKTNKNACATFNPDAWWSEQQKLNPNAAYRVNIRRSASDPVLKRPKSATRSRSKLEGGEAAMSTKDLKSYLTESRNSKSRPPSSRMYLAEYKKKQDQAKEAVMAAILEEANNRETKVNVCLEEANSYAKYLGLTRRFNIFWRSSDINNRFASTRELGARPMNTYEMAMATQKAVEHNPNVRSSLQGTGTRIEKMMVEVMEKRGEATKLITADNFLKEHEQLQLEVRRKRNLMSTEARVQEEREEKNKAKDTGGKRKGVVDDQEAVLLHLERMKAKEASKSGAKSSFVRRKETEEKVNKILENTANVTKILENQLRELQSRGWNDCS